MKVRRPLALGSLIPDSLSKWPRDNEVTWTWWLALPLVMAVLIPLPASAFVRTPRDSPAFGHGRIAPSPPVTIPPPREPPPEWTQHQPPPRPGFPDPDVRPLCVPETHVWNGFRWYREPGHCVWLPSRVTRVTEGPPSPTRITLVLRDRLIRRHPRSLRPSRRRRAGDRSVPLTPLLTDRGARGLPLRPRHHRSPWTEGEVMSVERWRGDWHEITFVTVAAVVMFLGCNRAPDHEAERRKLYRQDDTYCETYASKREEARKLLAFEWPTGTIEERMERMEQKYGAEAMKKIERDVANLPAVMEAVMEREKADYIACMIGNYWEKESLIEMAAKEQAIYDACEAVQKPRRGLMGGPPWCRRWGPAPEYFTDSSHLLTVTPH